MTAFVNCFEEILFGRATVEQQLDYVGKLSDGFVMGFPMDGDLVVEGGLGNFGGPRQMCRLGGQAIGRLHSIARDHYLYGKGDWYLVAIEAGLEGL